MRSQRASYVIVIQLVVCNNLNAFESNKSGIYGDKQKCRRL